MISRIARRLLLAACEARGIECVEVWSPPYARMLSGGAGACADGGTTAGLPADALRELAEQVAPAPGDEAHWAMERGLEEVHSILV